VPPPLGDQGEGISSRRAQLTAPGAICLDRPMTDVRFPQRKYLRQLRDMREDLVEWSKYFDHTGRLQSDLAVARRHAQRAEMLHDIQAQLLRAFLILEELPRLS